MMLATIAEVLFVIVFNADCVAVDIGSFKSLTLSTFPSAIPILFKKIAYAFEFNAI